MDVSEHGGYGGVHTPAKVHPTGEREDVARKGCFAAISSFVRPHRKIKWETEHTTDVSEHGGWYTCKPNGECAAETSPHASSKNVISTVQHSPLEKQRSRRADLNSLLTLLDEVEMYAEEQSGSGSRLTFGSPVDSEVDEMAASSRKLT